MELPKEKGLFFNVTIKGVQFNGVQQKDYSQDIEGCVAEYELGYTMESNGFLFVIKGVIQVYRPTIKKTFRLSCDSTYFIETTDRRVFTKDINTTGVQIISELASQNAAYCAALGWVEFQKLGLKDIPMPYFGIHHFLPSTSDLIKHTKLFNEH